MNNLLTTGSVLAAFFAGGVALFAPCCIVFLAPSYLAVAVKNHRWRLLPLTKELHLERGPETQHLPRRKL